MQLEFVETRPPDIEPPRSTRCERIRRGIDRVDRISFRHGRDAIESHVRRDLAAMRMGCYSWRTLDNSSAPRAENPNSTDDGMVMPPPELPDENSARMIVRVAMRSATRGTITARQMLWSCRSAPGRSALNSRVIEVEGIPVGGCVVILHAFDAPLVAAL